MCHYLKYLNEDNPMMLSEMSMYNQPNHFATQVTVIPIFKIENKNRKMSTILWKDVPL